MSSEKPDAKPKRSTMTSVKDHALEQLKQYLLSEEVRLASRLPSERELAERLGVGRNSIREALKVLEALGLVESRVGEGTFVVAQTGASIGRTIGLGLAAKAGTIVSLNDARLIIEVGAARAAAERATREEIRDIATELHRMDLAAEYHEYLVADMNFHRLVARASQNMIVYEIVKNLIDLLETTLEEIHLDTVGTTYEESGGTHHLVYAAIVRHDPDAAAQAMTEHLSFTRQLWQALTTLSPLEPKPDSDTP